MAHRRADAAGAGGGPAAPEAPGPRDLNAAVADMEPILHRVAGCNVEVAVSLAAGLPEVRAGSGKLEQVLLNLAANARDAMPQGGKLTIQTQPASEARAILVVTDTGCGMDAQTKKRLFEPFFTTKGEGKGTGLGMAIIQDAVGHCGGSVEVDSTPRPGDGCPHLSSPGERGGRQPAARDGATTRVGGAGRRSGVTTPNAVGDSRDRWTEM